ncbi:MAG: cysteine dioxygenase [Azoarcus sp.]|jgi:predicted metal-dependent enzyme (double-stranded beta helix superfamily)|nr:cysteine dioxygenase [Azoarcus sp.]
MSTQKLLTFVQDMTRLLETRPAESVILDEGGKLVAALVSSDEWLPEAFARPHPAHYQQYLLYADPLDRLSIVSFVWGPGQKTPVHDHLVWGIVGGLRGEECETTFRKQPDGSYKASGSGVLEPGEVTAVSPAIGDVHEVANNLADRPSISIHVYGKNIGRVRRHVFDPATGEAKSFVSGYSNDVVPNLWH